MDHSDAVRLKATERYLLNELDPEQLDQFEEHLFDCPNCALDVRAAAMFLEQSKNVLSQPPGDVAAMRSTPARKGWFSWRRPAFALPAVAALLAIIAYQNLVTYPHMQNARHRPQVMPWASVNVGTWGAGGPVVAASPGQGFLLFVRIPPEGGYASYTADLYNPAGRLEWSLNFPAGSGQDQWPIQIPAAKREAGTYTVVVRGTTAAGDSKDLGRTSFELQIQK
jgi:Putative zinc-finger